MKRKIFALIFRENKEGFLFLLLSVFSLCFISCANLYIPFLYGRAIDKIIKGIFSKESIVEICIFFIVQVIIYGLNFGIEYWLFSRKKFYQHRASFELFKKLLKSEPSAFSKVPMNEYVYAIMVDTENLVSLCTYDLANFVRYLILFLGAILLLSFFTSIGYISILLILLYLVLGYKLQLAMGEISEKMRGANTDMVSKIMDPLYNYQYIKAHNAENRILRYYDASLKEFLHRRFVFNKIQSFSFWLLKGLEVGISLLCLSIVILRQNPTLGEIVTISLVLAYLLQSANSLVNIIIGARSKVPSLKKVVSIVCLPPEYNIAGELPRGFAIKFNNVSYSQGSKTILANLNFEIGEREKVGIVGRSGEGKSTLVKMLLGLMGDYEGDIYLGEVELRKISRSMLRQVVTYIPQTPFIYPGTIRENFTILDNYSDEEIWWALDMVGLKEYVESLPGQLNYQILSTNIFLSGGEQQKLSIARAFLRKNAKVVIVDESVSHLDSLSEQKIFSALEKLCEGKTLIVIAHRISTLANLDKIHVLENGKITKSGAHRDLIKNSELYREICKLQLISM
ncbi:MAG: ABC transporter ATP-binding protein [candidate division WOR-3 bacterium]